MGIIIQNNIETNVGEIENAYVVVSSYKVLKTSQEIQYSIRYFSSKEYWEQSLPKTIEEASTQPDIPSNAIFSPNSILFENNEEFLDISLPSHFRLKPTKIKTISTPIFETQEQETIVPYVSFNREGKEITLERKVIKPVEVKIGENKTEQKVINYDAFKEPTKFIYNHLKTELKSLLPGVRLKDN